MFGHSWIKKRSKKYHRNISEQLSLLAHPRVSHWQRHLQPVAKKQCNLALGQQHPLDYPASPYCLMKKCPLSPLQFSLVLPWELQQLAYVSCKGRRKLIHTCVLEENPIELTLTSTRQFIIQHWNLQNMVLFGLCWSWFSRGSEADSPFKNLVSSA